MSSELEREAELTRSRGAPLIAALEQRMPGAAARGEIAAALAAAIAAELAEDEVDPALIAEAARLQEIGRLYSADASHHESGRAVVLGAGVPPRVGTWILHARERWDGAGPGGLSGHEIPIGSRVIAVTREYLDGPAFAAEDEDPRAAGLRRLGELAGGVLDPMLAAKASRLAAAPGDGD